jgi:hypothetical protein
MPAGATHAYQGMKTMIRTSLIAFAALATIAAASPAAAQAGAPVRTLTPANSATATTVLIAERKAAACADKECTSKPVKRAYAGAAPLGW